MLIAIGKTVKKNNISTQYIGIGYDMGDMMGSAGNYMYFSQDQQEPVQGWLIEISQDSSAENNGLVLVGSTSSYAADGTQPGVNYYNNPLVSKRTRLIAADDSMDNSLAVSTPGSWQRTQDVTSFNIGMGTAPIQYYANQDGYLTIKFTDSNAYNPSVNIANRIYTRLMANSLTPENNGFANKSVTFGSLSGYMSEDLSAISNTTFAIISSEKTQTPRMMGGGGIDNNLIITLNTQIVPNSEGIGSGLISFNL